MTSVWRKTLPRMAASFGAMSKDLQLTVVYEEPDEDDWIVARVAEVPGAMSQGRTREEARENVVDALRLMSRSTSL